MLMIQGKRVDDPQHVYIIAEAAGSHCQDYATAEALVRAAAWAGADAIKFQTIDPARIAADIPFPFGHDPQTDAWARRLGVTSFRDLYRHGGLPRPWHAPLRDLAHTLGLAFLSSPFDLDSARFLVEEIGVPALKIASGNLTFPPLLQYAAQHPIPTLLSTGAATLAEVQTALDTLYVARGPAWSGVVLLHCVSVYPCPLEALNLFALSTLRSCVEAGAVGFSDHTTNRDVVPALAVAYGATVYEKHLKLAEDMTSIDAAHSLTPAEFQHLVETIRLVPQLLGDGVKAPHPLEAHDRLWARRSPTDWLRPTDAARAGAWQ